MFSKVVNAVRTKISIRMAIWYSFIFIASAVAFFLIGYLLLSSSLRQKDREVIESKLEEYSAQYQKGGLDALKNAASEDAGRFFVRITGSKGDLFLLLPSNFYDEEDVEKKDPKFNINKLQRSDWIRLKSEDDEEFLEIATQGLPDGNVLQVGRSTEETDDIMERFQDVFLLTLLGIIVVGVAFGAFFTYRAFRPVRELTALTRNIVSTGKMDARVPIGRTQDELQELAMLFNQMMERIDVLIRGMRESLDNVAHDLRTPMTRLRGKAEVAMNANSESDYREALSDCLEESERVISMLNTLMDISEAESGAMKLNEESLDVHAVLEDMVDLYRYVADEKGIAIHMICPNNLHITADRNRIQQVIANLLDNAVKYTGANGIVNINASAANGSMILTIQDNGIGIADPDIGKVWDRLYRGDKSRSQRGLGLGLSFVRAIVQAHRGTVAVSSKPGQGSIFTVHLPSA